MDPFGDITKIEDAVVQVFNCTQTCESQQLQGPRSDCDDTKNT